MAAKPQSSETSDPLREINGPSLFPRTVKASSSSSGPVPTDFKDLASIHNYMKSLELRSPEKLMNEAKKIVDGGAELLESNLVSFAGNGGIEDAIAAKGKDKPRERRPGLGIVRTRRPFTLRPSVSQPSICLEPTVNVKDYPDPDDYFDAVERNEKARKEIRRLMGIIDNDFESFIPPTTERPRRQGLLGKSYKGKHRYSVRPSVYDDILIPSQETVEQELPSEVQDDSQEKLFDPDHSPDNDVEEVEVAGSSKKAENGISSLLNELLSLDEGADFYNIIQDRLQIKPLDREILYHDFGKSRTSSLNIGSALKCLNRKLPVDNEQVAHPVNSVSSPTPPRSPFASISLLTRKKILQSNPLNDPFSPVNIDCSARRNASPIHRMDNLHEQVEAQKDLEMSSELESHVEAGITEPTNSDTGAGGVMANADDLAEQFVEENVSMQIADADGKETTNLNDTESSPSLLEDEAMDDPSSKQQTVPDEQPELPQAKLKTGRRKADAKRNNARPMKKSFAEQSNPSMLEAEVMADPPSTQQIDPAQQPEVHQAKLQKRKREVGERLVKIIKNAHPMTKSLAEAGTSFDNGVRRSKRIRIEPLKYWKGEKFVHGRVDDGLELLGVKYLSPGKGSLKVKSYVSDEYKELLETEAGFV